MIGVVSGALLLLGATPVAVGPADATPGCAGLGVVVDSGFDQAGFASCTVEADGSITVTIAPETLPINPSPWYALRLTQADVRERTVRLSYQSAPHRYAPWFSANDDQWQRLPTGAIAGDRTSVSIVVPPFSGQAYVAAQPLRSMSAVEELWSARVDRGLVAALPAGLSVDGRAVPLFRFGPQDAQVVHVIAARQHPPETTGAAAFDGFASHLIDRDGGAPCAGNAILFAPILNPDGIARGHWRTNAGLVDINRDWGRFTQPETAGLGTVMTDAAERATVAAVIDFHSTRRGAIYVSRSADARATAFAAAIERATGLVVIETRAGEATTLKSWSEDRLGSASFTVELPDDATPQQAAVAGGTIAELFVAHYLCPVTGVAP